MRALVCVEETERERSKTTPTMGFEDEGKEDYE